MKCCLIGRFWFVLAMSLALNLVVSTPQVVLGNMPEELPDGISLGEWMKIQSQIRKASYNIDHAREGEEAVYRATNRRQGYQTRFHKDKIQVSPRGKETSEWNFSMRLTGYGYGENIQPVSEPEIVTEGNRVEYRRGNITEWYVNDGNGLEQGFTIQNRPEENENGPFKIQMKVKGDFTPFISKDKQSINFKDASGQTVLKYHKLLVIDAEQKTVPAYLLTVESDLMIIVEESAAVYPLTVDPVIINSKQITAFGASGDRIGYSVSVDGDTLAVGADSDDDGGNESGSVYIFKRNQDGSDNWGLVKKLNAPDAAEEDYFGCSVSVSGDTIIVGAYEDDDNGYGAGSAYLFERDRGGTDNWGQTKKLTASDAAAYDNFGYSVSISADTVVVGVYGDDDGGSASGSAYLFERDRGGADNWGQTKKLTASDAAAYDNFGCSVSISADTVVVGADRDDDDGSGSGSAYIFERNLGGTDNWGQTKKITASDAAELDLFGHSVAISADTLVIGAYSDEDGGASSGSAYLFERNRGGMDNWGQTKKLTASDAAAYDYFGYSVSISGDTVVIGAYGDDDPALESGSAYIFERNLGGTDNWGQTKKIMASDGSYKDYFGYSVSIDSDTVAIGAYGYRESSGSVYLFGRSMGGADNWGQLKTLAAYTPKAGDAFGYSASISTDTLVVGAYGDDEKGFETGTAYVFERDRGGTDNWGQTKKLTASDAEQGDYFGYSISISGDTLVVGAPGGSDNGTDSGAAYVFERNLGGPDKWGQVKKLLASDAEAKDLFGSSVTISGDTVVIGAYEDDEGSVENSGSAYVYERYGGGMEKWGQTKKLTASDLDYNGFFGCSVSINRDTLVVGAYGDDYGGTDTGAAYVFDRNFGGTDNWGQTKKLKASDASAHDEFGYSVSISGDGLIVGAYKDDDGGTETGSAYIFNRNLGGTNNWGQSKKLTASDPDHLDYFGYSVSISHEALVVGAYGYDEGFSQDVGSAYVFARNMGGIDNWGQLKKLTGQSFDNYFGCSVSINYNTLVVGEFMATAFGADAGSASVYEINLVPYVISITRYGNNPTKEMDLDFEVVFSESVSSVDPIDFIPIANGITCNGTTCDSSHITVNSFSGERVVVTASGIEGEGTIGLNLLDNDSIVNSGNIPLCGDGDGCNFTGQVYEVDTISPTVTKISSTASDNTYGVGTIIPITITFNEIVTVSGSPQLTLNLNSGGIAVYQNGSGTDTLTFNYVVAAGDSSADLDYTSSTALFLNDETLVDWLGNSADTNGDGKVILPEPGSPNSLGASKNIAIDTDQPNAPIVSGPDRTNDTTPYWTWSQNSSNPGIGTFRYKLNDNNLSTGSIQTTNNYYEPGNPLLTTKTEAEQTLYVQEVDDAGNWSVSGSHTVLIDILPPGRPTVLLSGDYLTNNSAVTWTWTSGGGGIGMFRYNLDDSNLEIGETKAINALTLNDLPEGVHRLYVQEMDNAGNWSNYDSASVEVDTTPPTHPFVWTSTPLTNNPNPIWQWSPGGGGDGTFQCRLEKDGKTVTTVTLRAVQFIHDTDLSDGIYTLYVKERDAAGNWSPEESAALEVDRSAANAPTVTSSTPTNENPPTWQWTSGGGIGMYRYKLDPQDPNDPRMDVGSVETFAIWYRPSGLLPDGDHFLFVQEADNVGNWSPYRKSRVEVDTAAPCSEADAPAFAQRRTGGFTVTYTFDEVYTGEDCDKANSETDVTGSGLVRVELWAKAPVDDEFQHVAEDLEGSIDGEFQYEPPPDTEGVFYFYTLAFDRAGNAEPMPQSEDTQTVYGADFAGYAVVAVGSVSNQEGLESHTRTGARIYEHLRRRNFLDGDGSGNHWADPLDHIKFFTPFDDIPVAGVDDYTVNPEGGLSLSYKSAMEHALTDWAPKRINEISGPLWIVLLDHGAPDMFFLDGFSQITPEQLDAWLDDLEAALPADYFDNPDHFIAVVLGACYSGSFIDTVAAPGRIIITSSAKDEVSYRGPRVPGMYRDGEFFVSALFNELGKGTTLSTSYGRAVELTENHTDSGMPEITAPYFDRARQHPYFDDDGDPGTNDYAGSHSLNTGGDGDLCRRVRLGYGDPGEPLAVVEIGKADRVMAPDQVENTLWATTNLDPSADATRIRVWVEIRKPDLILDETSSTEDTSRIVDLESGNLEWNPDLLRYETTYRYFDLPGRYTLYFYAMDTEEIISHPERTFVYKSLPNSPPDAFSLIDPADGATTPTSLLLDWSDADDPDGDLVTYTVTVSETPDMTTPVVTRNDQTNSHLVLTEDDGIADGGTYYWHVRADDGSGEGPEAGPRAFTTDNPVNPTDLIVEGFVFDLTTEAPVPRADLVYGDVPIQADAQGGYAKVIAYQAGFAVSVAADGYLDGGFTVDGIAEGTVVQRDFGLTPNAALGPGNIDGIGPVDLADAILALKIAAGIDLDGVTVSLSGDVNDNDRIGIEEAVFVLREVAEMP